MWCLRDGPRDGDAHNPNLWVSLITYQRGGDRSHSPNKHGGDVPPLPASPGSGHERAPSAGRSLSRGSNGARDSPTKGYGDELEPVQYGAVEGADAREELETELPSRPAFPQHRSSSSHPVMPVMPEFDDLHQTRSNSYYEPPAGADMKRKTSIVKRFKDKVAK